MHSNYIYFLQNLEMIYDFLIVTARFCIIPTQQVVSALSGVQSVLPIRLDHLAGDIPLPLSLHKSCLQSQHFLKNSPQSPRDVSSGNPRGPPGQPSLPLPASLPPLSQPPTSPTNILSDPECQYNFYDIQFSSMRKVKGNFGIIDTQLTAGLLHYHFLLISEIFFPSVNIY